MAFWLASLKNLLSVAGITGGYPVPQPREGSMSAITPSYSNPAAKTDIFERGAWWKNRVTSRVNPLNDVKRCACGDCRECASRAYENQISAFRQTIAVAGVGEPLAVSQPERLEDITADEEKKKEAAAEEKRARMRAAGEEELDTAERLLLAELKSTDAAVRRHERAHLAVAGSLARGGANYDYRLGPDGNRYAVGGDVSIDVSRAGDPRKTISKMERVRAAALAPAVPSAQDRRVAATADMIKLEARQELENLVKEEMAEKQEEGEEVASSSAPPESAG